MDKIPEKFYIFQLYNENNYIDRYYKENFIKTNIIKSATFIKGQKVEDTNYLDFFNPQYTNAYSKFGIENINNEFEIKLEKYRKKYFPQLPSRYSCIFAFESYEMCELVSQCYHWNLMEVNCFKPNKIIAIKRVNMEIISALKDMYNLFDEESLKSYFNMYFSGELIKDIVYPSDNKKISFSPIYEYLIEGELELVK